MSTENSPGAVNKRTSPAGSRWLVWVLKGLAWMGGTLLAIALSVAMAGLMALAIAYPNLPDVSELSNYRPKLPLRVYSSEERDFTPDECDFMLGVANISAIAIENARMHEATRLNYELLTS